MFHLKTTVELHSESVDVSTIELPGTLFAGYETCLFFSDGSSEVVESYSTAEEAAQGHAAWTHPGVASYVRYSYLESNLTK